MKKILMSFIMIILVFMIACTQQQIDRPNIAIADQPNNIAVDEIVHEEQLVGGDRDEHGCIGSAGYTWCEQKQKCLRIWEEDCPGLDYPIAEDNQGLKTGEERAIDIARYYVENTEEYQQENGRDLQLKRVMQAQCVGCWGIEFEFCKDCEEDSEKIEKVTVNVLLTNWEITKTEFGETKITQILTPEECTGQGGRLVNTVGGITCAEDETEIGEVTAFISPNICCIKK